MLYWSHDLCPTYQTSTPTTKPRDSEEVLKLCFALRNMSDPKTNIPCEYLGKATVHSRGTEQKLRCYIGVNSTHCSEHITV